MEFRPGSVWHQSGLRAAPLQCPLLRVPQTGLSTAPGLEASGWGGGCGEPTQTPRQPHQGHTSPPWCGGRTSGLADEWKPLQGRWQTQEGGRRGGAHTSPRSSPPTLLISPTLQSPLSRSSHLGLWAVTSLLLTGSSLSPPALPGAGAPAPLPKPCLFAHAHHALE